MSKQPDVFIAVPCYGGKVGEGAVQALLYAQQAKIPKSISLSGFSILTRNFNILWTQALNTRKQGTTHFCMLHDDIVPPPGWLEKMLAIMDKHGADILSVVSPLKDNRGLTSTAIDEPMGNADQRYRVRRLTLSEIYEKHPPTFTYPGLLVNTGLMLVKLTEPWAEKLWFEFDDTIIQRPDGMWGAAGMSEDWLFSRKANALGLKVFATRELPLQHIGMARFSNEKWGSVKEDSLDA